MRVRLLNLQPPASIEVEADAFVFASDELLKLPGDEMVAKYVRSQWQVGDERYLRLEIVHRVECHFEGAGKAETGGPFSRLMAVDGVLMGDDESLAVFRGGRWHSLATGSHWTRIAVTSA